MRRVLGSLLPWILIAVGLAAEFRDTSDFRQHDRHVQSRAAKDHVLLDAPMPTVILPTSNRRGAAHCELSMGCIPAGAQVIDHFASRNVGRVVNATATKEVNMTTTGAANHISLSMSPTASITCPDFTSNHTLNTSTVSLYFASPLPKSMFLEFPFLSAGSEYGCLDSTGEAVPVYMKVLSEAPTWRGPLRVTLDVRKANITELFVGDIMFTINPDPEDPGTRAPGATRRSSEGMHRTEELHHPNATIVRRST